MNGPSLTEPGITYFLSQTLKECRSYKDRNISLIFNLSMTTAFLLVFGVILLLKYKGKPTPKEIARKNNEKKAYIISKLQQIALVKNKKDDNMITDLPLWHDNTEISLLQKNI
jgi:hypothetical protein|uniref:Uncharacterized protein n=1 Tax=viral metagenome TaxID=1070528 RepID=A0A6C0JF44_9ZZZZ